MPTDQQIQAAQPSPQPTDDAWKAQQEQNLFNLYVAERAMQLDKQQKQQERVFAVANFAVSGNAEDAIVKDGDEMGVSVGNTVNNYYASQEATVNNPSQPAATPASSSTPAPTSPVASVAQSLPKWVMPVALLAASALTGGGSAALVSWLNSAPAVVQQVVGDTDTDTNSAIELGQ